MLQFIGLLGSLVLALSAVPEVHRTIKDNHCYVGWGMLLAWFIGELLLIIYILMTTKDIILLLNYFLNIILISILIKYKFNK